MILRQTAAVFEKDIKSEVKTRYALNAVMMFVLTTVSMIVFSTADEKLTTGLAAGVLWIIMFFSAMTGLAKSFVSEEERGTSLLLQLCADSSAVFFGKLLFNITLTAVLYGLACLLFFMFLGSIEIKNYTIFILTFLLGSLGTASAVTIIAAIISKANTKSALFPVLSFPILLPLIITGVEATSLALSGVGFEQAQTNFVLMFSYSAVLISVSFMLFDFVWKD